LEIMVFESFAQRLLNPFRGVMHTLRYASAEAVTVDGVHWDIYVANTVVPLASGRGQISEIRYGKWSPGAGLKRGRLYPSDEFRRMESVGAVLFEQLTRVHRQVPFAFQDRFELWLLDDEARPLALLDSALAENTLRFDLATDWRAGIAARESFQSPVMATLPRANSPTTTAADYLTGYINARAGKPAAAQWFRRAADGQGVAVGGIKLPNGIADRMLAAAAFPPFFLTVSGHDAAHRKLIEDFLAWQAPWFLLLPFDSATRATLEQQARRQALVVDALHRLYPACVDDGFIPGARVEAVLRRSQPSLQQKQDDSLAPFYIELNEENNE
jgi:hypothetical protein